jgi:2'-5' RNA ligase
MPEAPGQPASAAGSRLFLAIWPTAAGRAALVREAARWSWPAGARPTPPDKLHLTLHFLGQVATDRLPSLRDRLQVPFRPFALRLTGQAIWQRGMAVLLAEPDPALLDLHQRLGQALGSVQPTVDSRPFAPHVTLARHATGVAPPAMVTPVRWRVHSYALVSSMPGGGYRCLQRYRAD